MIKILLALSIPVWLAMLCYGAVETYEQHRLISTALPVEAVIVSVDMLPAGKDQYRPVVRFLFKVQGHKYQGHQLFPFDESGSLSWVRNAVYQFKENQQVQAYYDPTKPSVAFLIAQYRFAPYGMVLLGLGGAMAIACLLRSMIREARRKARGPREVEGWYLLERAATLAGAARNFLVFAGAWLALGGAVCVHYLWAANDPWHSRGAVVMATWNVIGLGLLAAGLNPLWISRYLGDAVVLLSKPGYRAGDKVVVCVQQPVKTSCQIRDMCVELRCEQVADAHVKVGPVEPAKTVWKTKDTALVSFQAAGGQVLRADFEIDIPTDAASTGKSQGKENQTFQWKLVQTTRVRGLPPCPDSFDLIVHAPLPAEADVIVAEIAD